MKRRQPAINPTLLIQDGGADVGSRRGINLGDGLTLSGDEDGVVTLDASGGSSRQTVLEETDSFTVTAEQEGALIRMTNAGAATVTLPAGLPIGFFVDVAVETAQQTGFAAFIGATALSRGNRTVLNGQYARARAQVISTNTWLLDGDLVVGG